VDIYFLCSTYMWKIQDWHEARTFSVIVSCGIFSFVVGDLTVQSGLNV